MDNDTDIPEIAAFQPGYWNGEYYDADYIRKVYQNYLKYCTGPNKEFTPWLNLNHKDEFQFGEIASARLKDASGENPVLMLKPKDVPQEVLKLLKGGQLKNPSVEFITPAVDKTTGKRVGYFDRNGRLEEGPVLKCLSLLGNELQGVRGLPPLPKPTKTFRAHVASVRIFRSIHTMDRQSLISTLQSLGVDTAAITDAVPDPLLESWIASLQKASAGTAPAETFSSDMTNPNGNTNGVQTNMAAGAISQPTNGGVNSSIAPASVTLKFRDEINNAIRPLVAGLNAQLAAIKTQADAVTRHNSESLNRIKGEAISRFLDELSGPACLQLTPAMIPTVKTTLERCDHTAVRKFSTDSNRNGTELEETMDMIRATYPKQRVNTRIPQPAVSGASGGTTTNTTPGKTGELSQWARETLGKFPTGRAALGRIKS